MDETRQLLKIFGVAATDFEAEAQKLAEVAARFSSRTGRDEIAKHLRNVTESCRELNTRWFDVTQRNFTVQNELLARCADAAVKVQRADDTTEVESARMEAGE
jgi:hypothetical protein